MKHEQELIKIKFNNKNENEIELMVFFGWPIMTNEMNSKCNQFIIKVSGFGEMKSRVAALYFVQISQVSLFFFFITYYYFELIHLNGSIKWHEWC